MVIYLKLIHKRMILIIVLFLFLFIILLSKVGFIIFTKGEEYIDRAYDKINEPIAKCVTYKGINHKGNY